MTIKQLLAAGLFCCGCLALPAKSQAQYAVPMVQQGFVSPFAPSYPGYRPTVSPYRSSSARRSLPAPRLTGRARSDWRCWTAGSLAAPTRASTSSMSPARSLTTGYAILASLASSSKPATPRCQTIPRQRSTTMTQRSLQAPIAACSPFIAPKRRLVLVGSTSRCRSPTRCSLIRRPRTWQAPWTCRRACSPNVVSCTAPPSSTSGSGPIG